MSMVMLQYDLVWHCLDMSTSHATAWLVDTAMTCPWSCYSMIQCTLPWHVHGHATVWSSGHFRDMSMVMLQYDPVDTSVTCPWSCYSMIQWTLPWHVRGHATVWSSGHFRDMSMVMLQHDLVWHGVIPKPATIWSSKPAQHDLESLPQYNPRSFPQNDPRVLPQYDPSACLWSLKLVSTWS